MADSLNVSGVIPLGEVTAAAGVKTAITANRTAPTAGYKVHGVILIAREGNTGRVDVYRSDREGGYTRIGYVPIPTTTTAPSFSIAMTAAAAAIQINDLYIAPVDGGNGVIVTALVA